MSAMKHTSFDGYIGPTLSLSAIRPPERETGRSVRLSYQDIDDFPSIDMENNSRENDQRPCYAFTLVESKNCC